MRDALWYHSPAERTRLLRGPCRIGTLLYFSKRILSLWARRTSCGSPLADLMLPMHARPREAQVAVLLGKASSPIGRPLELNGLAAV